MSRKVLWLPSMTQIALCVIGRHTIESTSMKEMQYSFTLIANTVAVTVHNTTANAFKTKMQIICDAIDKAIPALREFDSVRCFEFLDPESSIITSSFGVYKSSRTIDAIDKCKIWIELSSCDTKIQYYVRRDKKDIEADIRVLISIREFIQAYIEAL